MILYNANATQLADVTVSDDSYRYRVIMGENDLTLTFSLPVYLDIPLGTYCMFQADRYTLNRPATFEKVSSYQYNYTLIMGGASAAMDKYKMLDVHLVGAYRSGTNRVKFAYTAKAQEHLQKVVDNLNIRESGWSVGSCIASTEKVVSYNHNNCAEALKMIADTFKTEFEIVGKVISLKKVEYNKNVSDALALSYGFGHGFVSGVKRDNFDSSRAIEKLYVQGGSRNINASSYGAKELLLPKSQAYSYVGRNYASDADGLYIYRTDKALSTYVEESLDLSDIYPSRVGTVSTVWVVDAGNNFYDISDSSIGSDLDYNACLIPGEKMTIIFQSGMLAGKEFDCTYTTILKRFEIVPVEIDGIMMPGGGYLPVVGDTYAIFGISLPAAYICSDATKTGASWDMMKEAVLYLYDNEDSKFSFTGELDGIWSKSDWLNIGGKLKLGGYVSFTDSQFQTQGTLIRIVGIKDYINNPYSPQIELSNVTVQGSVLSSVIVTAETNEVEIINSVDTLKHFAKRGFADAKQTSAMLVAAALDGFTGSISPITVQTMQLLVGDESLQFYFVSSAASTAQIPHDEHYDPAQKKYMSAAGYLQHKSIGITALQPSHPASDFKTWSMIAYTSAVLDVPTKSYYVYAKVNRTTTAGTFLLSETAIAFKSDPTYYYLLVGILNSEVDGDRSYCAMYGFSELTPSRLTTQKIVSPDGRTYFDMVAGEIGGNIKFRATDDTLKPLGAEMIALQVAILQANAAVMEIGDDDRITPSEKQAARKEWDVIAAEQESLTEQSGIFHITTEHSNAQTIYANLFQYLNDDIPMQSGDVIPSMLTDANLSISEDITGTLWRAEWNAYYAARTILYNAFTAKAKEIADGALSQANNAFASAQAAEYLKTAMANATDINGGLISTSLVRVGAKNVAGVWVEKAGMNGVAGDDTTPRFYAGGTLVDAISRVYNGSTGTEANFVVTEDGHLWAMGAIIEGLIKTADSGQRIEIDPDSKAIKIYDSLGTLQFQIKSDALPSLASLLSGTTVTSPALTSALALNNKASSGYNTTDVYSITSVSPNSLTLAVGPNYNLTTPQINVTAKLMAFYDGSEMSKASIRVDLILIKPDASGIVVGTAFDLANKTDKNVSMSISSTQVQGMPGGTYYLKLRMTLTVVGVAQAVNCYASVGASPYNVLKGISPVQQTLISPQGLAMLKDTSNYVYDDVTTWEVLRGTSKVRIDASGVDGFGILAMGTVASNGVNNTYWGKYKSIANASKGGTGIYNVPHAVPSTSYQVFISANGGTLYGNIRSKSANTFQVAILSNAGTLTDAGFDYLIVGKVI